MPEGVAEIHRSTQVDLERFRCAPTAAGMVIESKVMSRWYAVASDYRPTKRDHDQKSTLMRRRLYKRWCSINRYTKVEALFVPQVDSGMGLMDAHTTGWWVSRGSGSGIYIRPWTTLAPPKRSTSSLSTGAGGAVRPSSSRIQDTSRTPTLTFGWCCNRLLTMWTSPCGSQGNAARGPTYSSGARSLWMWRICLRSKSGRPATAKFWVSGSLDRSSTWELN